MGKKSSESRSIRVNLDTYLASGGWSGLTFTEGWEELDIENPLVNVFIIDEGKDILEIGRTNIHQLYNRVIQVDIYMESEARVEAMCEDVMEFLDTAQITIVDTFTTSGIGYLSFPNSNLITYVTIPPEFNNPEILRWRGVVRGKYEAYYPNAGNPF